ncbi:MAG: hypothetical protein E7266_08785 [Lachnospiraceae bacterium]|nr:hypothetical protein [Lachnospiraceae bacterium]
MNSRETNGRDNELDALIDDIIEDDAEYGVNDQYDDTEYDDAEYDDAEYEEYEQDAATEYDEYEEDYGQEEYDESEEPVFTSVEKEKTQPARNMSAPKKAVSKKRRVDSRKRAKRSRTLRNLAMEVLGFVIRMCLYAAIIYFVYSICSDAYTFGTKLFTESGVAEEDSVEDVEVVVTIPAGASRSEVAAILKDNGLIEDEKLFLIQSYLYEGKFYSGTYTLRTSYEPEVIVDILSGIEY